MSEEHMVSLFVVVNGRPFNVVGVDVITRGEGQEAKKHLVLDMRDAETGAQLVQSCPLGALLKVLASASELGLAVNDGLKEAADFFQKFMEGIERAGAAFISPFDDPGNDSERESSSHTRS
jgi:hypothetical protein